VTVLELVQRITALMESPLAPEIRNEVTHEIRRQYLSAAKAREMLGWRPLFSLDDGLQRTIAWHREALETGACQLNFGAGLATGSSSTPSYHSARLRSPMHSSGPTT